MKIIENDNSIRIFELYNTDEDYGIIMELCDCNLRDRLNQTSIGCGADEIKMILTQLNKTFRIMIENKIMHRDIKLENILLKYTNDQKTNYIVKLSDYGISKQLNTLSQNKASNVGTCVIKAPEIIKQEPYNNKCDLWSLGIIIYQLCFKEAPYDDSNDYILIEQINKFKQNIFKKNNNQLLDDLISRLLRPNPNERINWDEYFDHPFLK